MRIVLHGDFRRRYQKLKPREQRRVLQRLLLFREDPAHPLLNSHKLSGKYKGLSSINIGGDLRALYQLVKKDLALFILVDTHTHLYG